MQLDTATLETVQSAIARDVSAFAPELALCGAIVLLLLLRLFNVFNRLHLGWVALIASLVALSLAQDQWHGGYYGLAKPSDLAPAANGANLFTGLLIYDNLTVFMRIFLLAFAVLVVGMTMLTGIPDREDSGDFYTLLLGATLGMSIMASSNHLLMVFIGVEMASLPSYALAGFLKGKRQSSEAALKYVVYGGGASGVMLFGISLLAGKFGTGYLPTVAAGMVTAFSAPGADPAGNSILILGTLFLFIGIAFKLAAVPFHFWCPDVFEGASAEVAGFLSVASKGAALALMARVVLILGGLDASAQVADADWLKVARYLIPTIAVLAAVTATFGNLAAYMQTNLKRLLAYSTIAQAGYMMMGLATLTPDGVQAVLLYLVVYLFMNLGAFAVVAFLRNQIGSEDLADCRGLMRRAPILVVALAIFVLSLLGMPPLAGFAAKLKIFSTLLDGGNYYIFKLEELGRPRETGIGVTLYALLVVGGINTVLSAVYYIKVLKVMCLDTSLDEVEGRTPAPLNVPNASLGYTSVLALTLFLLLLFWNQLSLATKEGVNRFQRPERNRAAAVAPPAHPLEASP
jgi:NADH-quinone oxidoreductase subunit N